MDIINKVLRSQSLRPIAMLLVADLVFFSLVNPFTSSSFVLIIGCLLVGVSLYLLLLAFIKLFAIVIPFSKRSQSRLALFSSLLLIFLLLMQSVGQLSFRDVMAVVPLMIVLYVYLTYIDKNKLKQS